MPKRGGAGELEILGKRNAPWLGAIAWYAGNSGVGYELEQTGESASWPEKQYPHENAGTHPVGEKLPDQFGLLDMLLNVYEWCEDACDPRATYPPGDVVDPSSAREGKSRICRGGSWLDQARALRAAFRIGCRPDYRSDLLGFRLAADSVSLTRGSS